MPFSNDKPFGNEDQLSDCDGSRLSDCMACSSSDSDSPRESFTSDSSSKNVSPVSSPPRATNLDDVMATTRNLANLLLAHEIVANENFHLDTIDLPKNSLEGQVKQIVHKAFWDCLESELKEDPPEYEHAIKLFDEIKEILLSFLTPGTNRLRTQICEVLDVDLIRQQAEHNAVDIPKLGSYIINIMSKLCAPVRDDDVKKLKSSGDVVQMLRDVFHVLDLMRMDMVNYTIHTFRPQLQRQLAEYERVKFQEILEKSPDALTQTTKWIEESLKDALQAKVDERTSGANGGSVDNVSPTMVLNSGFVKLLHKDYDSVVPETVITDDLRIVDLKNKLHQVKLVACVCLITQNAMGSVCTTGFIEQVKEITVILLQGLNKALNLKEALTGLSTKISFEMNKSLTERGLPELGTEAKSILEGQICSLTEKNHSICNLIEKRIQEYLTTFLCLPYPYKHVPILPGGLKPVQKEIEFIGFHYSNIVNFNKQVYGPFYANIFRKLLFSQPQGEKAEAQSSAGEP